MKHYLENDEVMKEGDFIEHRNIVRRRINHEPPETPKIEAKPLTPKKNKRKNLRAPLVHTKKDLENIWSLTDEQYETVIKFIGHPKALRWAYGMKKNEQMRNKKGENK